jgi:hypothetical protein
MALGAFSAVRGAPSVVIGAFSAVRGPPVVVLGCFSAARGEANGASSGSLFWGPHALRQAFAHQTPSTVHANSV